MEKSSLRRAVAEVARTALGYVVFCTFALSLAALIVKACAPAQGAIVGMNWGIKCLGALLSGAILIGSERALFKGIAAGVLGCVLTMFLFAAIGGGFHVTPLFCLELPLTGILCGFGALVGGKFRKA